MKLNFSASLSGEQRRSLKGSISNPLAGTRTNILARRMQNEAAAQNTKKARQQEEVGIMGGLEETGVAMQQRLYGEANPHLHALVRLLRSGLFIYLRLVRDPTTPPPNCGGGGLLGSPIRFLL